VWPGRGDFPGRFPSSRGQLPAESPPWTCPLQRILRSGNTVPLFFKAFVMPLVPLVDFATIGRTPLRLSLQVVDAPHMSELLTFDIDSPRVRVRVTAAT
jgi:hypothetical protein